MNIVSVKELPENFLFPFSLTRSILDIRIGMLTLRQKWELVYGLTIDNDCMDNIIPANLLPSSGSAECIKQKNSGFSNSHFLQHPWQIFQLTDQALRDDFYFLTQNRESAKLPAINKTISPENIFIEEGAKVGYATLNASTGPIYISKNAEIMEGAMIRGPFFLGEESVVKMGSTIYGATSVGKKCTVGGEIKNAVFFDYSNKAHAGYLGDSVIGSWCNIGAGTSNSNLKNTASDVRAWSEKDKQYVSAGVKCGLLMGDYSRCAINTSFNTGTVTGVCCNIFSKGLAPKFIPNFSWGIDNASKYVFEKSIADISNWKKLKKERLHDIEIQTLKHIFDHC